MSYILLFTIDKLCNNVYVFRCWYSFEDGGGQCMKHVRVLSYSGIKATCWWRTCLYLSWYILEYVSGSRLLQLCRIYWCWHQIIVALIVTKFSITRNLIDVHFILQLCVLGRISAGFCSVFGPRRMLQTDAGQRS